MAETIFLLFALYTIACCLDGPDLKPKWKKWLGVRLAEYANRLHPINYCRPKTCKISIDNPFTRQLIVTTPALTKSLDANAMFTIHDIFFHDQRFSENGDRRFSERQCQFSRFLKQAINDIVFEIGKTAFQNGLVKLELVQDRYDSVVLYGNMQIVQPERSFIDDPFVLFENNKITVRYPDILVDMQLIHPNQIHY